MCDFAVRILIPNWAKFYIGNNGNKVVDHVRISQFCVYCMFILYNISENFVFDRRFCNALEEDPCHITAVLQYNCKELFRNLYYPWFELDFYFKKIKSLLV